MKTNIKKLWVKALRSGKYKQGKGSLYNEGKYCCLGVLSSLAVKAKVCPRGHAFDGNADLNECVLKWAGLRARDPKIRGHNLSIWNDDKGVPFKKIAKLIETRL